MLYAIIRIEMFLNTEKIRIITSMIIEKFPDNCNLWIL